MFLQRGKKIRTASRPYGAGAPLAGGLLEISPANHHICLSRGKFGMSGSNYRLNCAKIHQFLTVS